MTIYSFLCLKTTEMYFWRAGVQSQGTGRVSSPEACEEGCVPGLCIQLLGLLAVFGMLGPSPDLCWCPHLGLRLCTHLCHNFPFV